MAAPQLLDMVLETATNPGTASFVLNGAVSDRRSFAQAAPAGGSVCYYADDGMQAEWGIGVLAIGSPNTLSRQTVLGTTRNTLQVLNFTGTVRVYSFLPAQLTPVLDSSGALSVSGKLDAKDASFEALSVSGIALVQPVTDWSAFQAVGAAQAKAKFVKQGWGFANFNDNQIYMGWRTDGTGLGVAVDSTDLGNVAFQSWVGATYATQTALAGVASTASSAVAQAQAAQESADTKLNAIDGTATRLTINYGSMRAQFQTDGNLVLYAGDAPVFSISSSAINWNGHSFAFLDSLPMDSSKKILFDQVSGVASGGRVNFPSSFSSPPKVLAQNFGTGDANCHAATTDAGGFTLHINNGGSSDITYFAIGDR